MKPQICLSPSFYDIIETWKLKTHFWLCWGVLLPTLFFWAAPAVEVRYQENCLLQFDKDILQNLAKNYEIVVVTEQMEKLLTTALTVGILLRFKVRFLTQPKRC